MLAAFAVLLVRNALVYPAIAGIDAFEHIRQAWDLAVLGRLGTTGAYYTPPGWYAIAGELLRFGDWLDLHDVERPAQLLSAVLTVASAVLLLGIVERVFRAGRGFASGPSPASARARRWSSRPP